MARIREWFHRYAVAEVTGLVCALIAAVAAGRAAGPAAAAIAGTLGEGVGFYGVILLREVRRHGRHWRVARGLLIEFGVAELADTLAVRPLAIYAATMLAGDTVAGVLVGKVAADVVFYAVAITGYELHKRWAGRTAVTAGVPAAPRLAVTRTVGGPVDDRPVAGTTPAGRNYGQPTVALTVAGAADDWPVVGSTLAGRIYGRPVVTGRVYGQPAVAGRTSG